MGHSNTAPVRDGDVNTYVSEEARLSPWYDHGAKVVFINGMGNKPEDHRESALAISLLQMCEVTGVYNEKGSLVGDLVQCLGDKYQFAGPLARTPSEALDRTMAKLAKEGKTVSRADAMEQALSRNPACQSLFRVLRDPQFFNAPIYAHSQGNLILSNALFAIVAVDGATAIAGRDVRSYGSPTVNWPAGIVHQEFGFTFDPVSWLAGFDFSFSISKVGRHHYQGSSSLVSHGFQVYAENDPAFIVNRFRWGGWGMTVSLDEDGLADALISMKGNLRRVYPVFEHLQKHHNMDSDDVAVRYVRKMQFSPDRGAITGALRQHTQLKKLLIRVMDKGWTGGDEQDAIKFLKAL